MTYVIYRFVWTLLVLLFFFLIWFAKLRRIDFNGRGGFFLSFLVLFSVFVLKTLVFLFSKLFDDLLLFCWPFFVKLSFKFFSFKIFWLCFAAVMSISWLFWWHCWLMSQLAEAYILALALVLGVFLIKISQSSKSQLFSSIRNLINSLRFL